MLSYLIFVHKNNRAPPHPMAKKRASKKYPSTHLTDKSVHELLREARAVGKNAISVGPVVVQKGSGKKRGVLRS